MSRKAIPMPTRMPRKYSPTMTSAAYSGKKVTTIMVTHNLRYAVEYGDRLIMMHQGKAIIDKAGADKKAMQVDDILGTFNEISIECGN